MMSMLCHPKLKLYVKLKIHFKFSVVPYSLNHYTDILLLIEAFGY